MTNDKKEMEKILKLIEKNEKNKHKKTDLAYANENYRLFLLLKHKYGKYMKTSEKIMIAMGIKTAKTVIHLSKKKIEMENKQKKK